MKPLEQAIAEADTSKGGYHFCERVKEAARAGSRPAEVLLSVTPAKSEGKFVRVVYPHLNERYEIQAASEKELDAKEAQIRARYSETAK
jgi:hypothetical protein